MRGAACPKQLRKCRVKRTKSNEERFLHSWVTSLFQQLQVCIERRVQGLGDLNLGLRALHVHDAKGRRNLSLPRVPQLSRLEKAERSGGGKQAWVKQLAGKNHEQLTAKCMQSIACLTTDLEFGLLIRLRALIRNHPSALLWAEAKAKLSALKGKTHKLVRSNKQNGVHLPCPGLIASNSWAPSHGAQEELRAIGVGPRSGKFGPSDWEL